MIKKKSKKCRIEIQSRTRSNMNVFRESTLNEITEAYKDWLWNFKIAGTTLLYGHKVY